MNITIGAMYNRYTVLGISPDKKDGRTYWSCKCSCGVIKNVRPYHLKKGIIKSCGCWARDRAKTTIKIATDARRTHGSSRDPRYQHWLNMKARCNNPKSASYRNYGGRGINVCLKWLTDYVSFAEDMGPIPAKHTIEGPYSLERKDNKKGYSPENCRWATRREQANNTRRSRYVAYAGETLTLTQWSRKLNISDFTLRGRLDMGWSIEDAFTRPVAKYTKHSK